MSVKKILQNLRSIEQKSLPNEDFSGLYIHEYADLERPFDKKFLTEKKSKRIIQFLDDLDCFLYKQLGYELVIYNVPKTSKLYYASDFEPEEVTPEHMFDTIKEIDDSVKIVVAHTPSTYFVMCDNGEKVVQFLDEKKVGNSIVTVKSLKDISEKFVVIDDDDTKDVCTASIGISFVVALCSVFLFHWAFFQ